MSDAPEQNNADGGKSLSTVGLGEWLPIETYVPDGSDVLLFDGEKQFVGQKRLKVRQQFAPTPKITNWYSWDGLHPLPTHWMPLHKTPNAPANRLAEGESSERSERG